MSIEQQVTKPVKTIASSSGVKKYWPMIKKVVTYSFFVLIAYLIIKQAMTIEWEKVLTAFRETPLHIFAFASVIAIACFSVYASYDLIGRYFTKIKLSISKTWLVAILSYAFNLNLSSLVGGVAFRYRLYSRFGVGAKDVTKIIGISVATNWFGYIFLAGLLFVSGQIDVPQSWKVSNLTLQWIGAGFLCVVAGYFLLCAYKQGQEYKFKSVSLTIPGFKVATFQLLLACCHWCLMASVIYLFFYEQVSFFLVFAVLLVSAVAGAVTHIPGGLGVLEAVFVALLAAKIDKSQILAGLFAYRCVFYLLPLALATPVYLSLEAMVKGNGNETVATEN
ncbi:flippase-like domain-containing protein [Gilvimarinus agarilyticus]|uniref:lysylphosphatidylglycerol synthase domain-containing protein n=1 Tax=unclassified Gilvimarinus TaxID=2642066 RepID=UPI001C0A065A|nr:MULTISPECIES: lysylphosphatidylglycerol synthase domain-containing protein [unclassified Gilvimarinus]MBU2886267.1 flippase-like domain-containing protein [Gilvimarinus agarilyticus]MDO6570955.1 lysylphosphatidylglycerol synthase domain-containing protein [Gilvimarinus sp. 2_MG-2023]MDO6747758.1 lysylphosphatidylglycerol synthase domain-containing protein [Gilvimarinus sp. 1_MG-2023]